MKLIPLTHEKFAQVDDDDFEYLNQFKWYAKKGKKTYYAARTGSMKNKVAGKNIFMHREIIKLTDSKIFGEHKDHNGLNNQRNNLREATCSENNKNKSSCGKYAFLGVSEKKVGKYSYCRATIKANGKYIHLGYFKTEIEAALKYNEAAKIYHKEFANLNVIPIK